MIAGTGIRTANCSSRDIRNCSRGERTETYQFRCNRPIKFQSVFVESDRTWSSEFDAWFEHYFELYLRAFSENACRVKFDESTTSGVYTKSTSIQRFTHQWSDWWQTVRSLVIWIRFYFLISGGKKISGALYNYVCAVFLVRFLVLASRQCKTLEASGSGSAVSNYCILLSFSSPLEEENARIAAS